MNIHPSTRSVLARWLRGALGVGISAACLCAAPLAQAAQAVLLPEGPVTLIRATSVFVVDAPLLVEPGDIFTTGVHGAAQLEDGSGTIALLGSQTRITVDAAPSGAKTNMLDALSLLAGWLKVERGTAAAPGQLTVDTVVLRAALSHGAAVIHANANAASLFVETGSITLALPGIADAPQPLNAERYAQRESDKPLETRARPTPAFVGEMPLAFRDPLASIAARPQVKAAAPVQGRVVAYADIADWLASPLAVRSTFVARFRPLARAEPFRTQIRRNLRNLPEWRAVLCPPRPAPPRRPGTPQWSEVAS
ncbi:hypothetical protein [Caballeronia humi]|uniref:FecR protein domain-containing protein n=1 Tax=Caballeronia humi TaxID=326474 RepID=A0A158I1Q0_9BURK|nr:hypothetical protein [Caballeronia humi]SAL49950.1 hypothetical protein AWB65_04035 [Caballeronia humi]